MHECGSVSRLIAQAREGDEEAFAALHRRYWPALVAVARSRLKGAPLAVVDEEDVAQQAFFDLYRSLRAGRVPRLDDRHQLLALLTHIVACKALNEIKHNLARRAGGGRVRSLSPLAVLVGDPGCSPDERAILHDCYEFYVAALPERLRPFAELHLAGLTNREIAARLNCVERTVERKMVLLRARWQQLAAESIDRQVDALLKRRSAG